MSRESADPVATPGTPRGIGRWHRRQGVCLPILERDGLLAELSAALGSGRVALVAGEAGIGKTTLLRAFAAGVSPPARRGRHPRGPALGGRGDARSPALHGAADRPDPRSPDRQRSQRRAPGRESRDPHRAVTGGEDGPGTEASAGGERHQTAFPESFQPPVGRDPDVPLTVLQKIPDDIRQQAVLLGELLRLGTKLGDHPTPDPGRIGHSPETIAPRPDPE